MPKIGMSIGTRTVIDDGDGGGSPHPLTRSIPLTPFPLKGEPTPAKQEKGNNA